MWKPGGDGAVVGKLPKKHVTYSEDRWNRELEPLAVAVLESGSAGLSNRDVMELLDVWFTTARTRMETLVSQYPDLFEWAAPAQMRRHGRPSTRVLRVKAASPASKTEGS